MTVISGEHVAAEFSRVVPVEKIGARGLSLEFAADTAERRALAKRFGIPAIDSLSARARLRPGPGGTVRATVTFAADVVQSCVVTLEPVTSRIEEAFTVAYVPDGRLEAEQREVVVHVDEDDPPEPIVDGRIDIGEMVAQHLALALDPYPRKPGLELGGQPSASADAAVDESERPFAALAKLRKRD